MWIKWTKPWRLRGAPWQTAKDLSPLGYHSAETGNPPLCAGPMFTRDTMEQKEKLGLQGPDWPLGIWKCYWLLGTLERVKKKISRGRGLTSCQQKFYPKLKNKDIQVVMREHKGSPERGTCLCSGRPVEAFLLCVQWEAGGREAGGGGDIPASQAEKMSPTCITVGGELGLGVR